MRRPNSVEWREDRQPQRRLGREGGTGFAKCLGSCHADILQPEFFREVIFKLKLRFNDALMKILV